MNLVALLAAVSPILIIFLLLILKRTAADTAGSIGWLVALAVACLYFQTALRRWRCAASLVGRRRLAAHRADGGDLDLPDHPDAGDRRARPRRGADQDRVARATRSCRS